MALTATAANGGSPSRMAGRLRIGGSAQASAASSASQYPDVPAAPGLTDSTPRPWPAARPARCTSPSGPPSPARQQHTAAEHQRQTEQQAGGERLTEQRHGQQRGED